jgi:hypothetical protein
VSATGATHSVVGARSPAAGGRLSFLHIAVFCDLEASVHGHSFIGWTPAVRVSEVLRAFAS